MTQVVLKQLSNDLSEVIGDSQKIQLISSHVSSILEILGLDIECESLQDTPLRVATMYVEEVFSGLNP